MITCKSGVTIRMPVSGISEQGRATQGVKLIRLDEGDEIAAITNLQDQEHNGQAATEETAEGGEKPENGSNNATGNEENPSTESVNE
jgi:DNA gyrase subunit A